MTKLAAACVQRSAKSIHLVSAEIQSDDTTDVKHRSAESRCHEPYDDQQNDSPTLSGVETLVTASWRSNRGVVIDTESGQREDAACHRQN